MSVHLRFPSRYLESSLERQHDIDWPSEYNAREFTFAGKLRVLYLREEETGHEFDGVQLEERNIQVRPVTANWGEANPNPCFQRAVP